MTDNSDNSRVFYLENMVNTLRDLQINTDNLFVHKYLCTFLVFTRLGKR